MTWKRAVWLGLFVVLTLCIVATRFYLNIQNVRWLQNSEAVEIAYQKTALAKATKVESFYGDETFQIVHGEDREGQRMIVWVSGDEVHTEKADQAFTEHLVREIMAQKDPELELLRIMPGKMGDQYVWEVFYKKHNEDGERYFYDYYRFSDGRYIDTWRLSLH